MRLILFSLVVSGLAVAAGVPATCVPSTVPPGAIRLDAAWFATHKAPWLLDVKNGYYVLDVDAFAGGTAFVAIDAGVTLDLNCHRVVYGNGRPPAPPTWNASATESDPIDIPEAGIEYTAMVIPKGPSSAKVAITIVDASSRATLGTGTSPGVSRGFGAVARFVAKSTAPVRLRIDVTGTGVTHDAPLLMRSREFGVAATPSVWNLPEPLQSNAAVATGGRRVKNLTIKNGRLQQGWGRAFGGAAVLANWSSGLALEKVSVLVTGDDANPIDAVGVGGFRLVDSTLEAQTKRISNRMTIFAGANLGRAHGAIAIERTRFETLPQCGVYVARSRASDAPAGEAQSLRIVDNVFRLNGIVSDPYAILLVGVNHFLVARNVAHPISGRGMLLDGWGEAAIEDGEIRDNELEAYEKPNLEYGAALEATALRIRNWANNGTVAPDKGAVRRLSIHDNKFLARTDANGVDTAIAARVSFRNDDGRMDHAGNSISRNLFRAIADKAEYTAYALSFSGVYANVGLAYENDTFETNGTALRFGDSDSYRDREEDITLTGATITEVKRPAPNRFHAYEIQTVNTVRAIRVNERALGAP